MVPEPLAAEKLCLVGIMEAGQLCGVVLALKTLPVLELSAAPSGNVDEAGVLGGELSINLKVSKSGSPVYGTPGAGGRRKERSLCGSLPNQRRKRHDQGAAKYKRQQTNASKRPGARHFFHLRRSPQSEIIFCSTTATQLHYDPD